MKSKAQNLIILFELFLAIIVVIALLLFLSGSFLLERRENSFSGTLAAAINYNVQVGGTVWEDGFSQTVEVVPGDDLLNNVSLNSVLDPSYNFSANVLRVKLDIKLVDSNGNVVLNNAANSKISDFYDYYSSGANLNINSSFLYSNGWYYYNSVVTSPISTSFTSRISSDVLIMQKLAGYSVRIDLVTQSVQAENFFDSLIQIQWNESEIPTPLRNSIISFNTTA